MAMNDPQEPFNISIWQQDKLLRAFGPLTRDVVRDYLQEMVNAGLPVASINFGDGFNIMVVIPDTLRADARMFLKWIVEGGPLADELEQQRDRERKP
jgi:hypothetical protein